MPSNPLARLLIVDDETAQMEALSKTLAIEGYRTVGFASANEALAALKDQTFDLVLTDLMMPEMDGITFLRRVFEIDSNLVGIVMTGHATVDTAVEALKAGALDYITKPFRLSAILPVLGRALTLRRLRMENIQLREAVGIHELSTAIALALDHGTVLEKVADAAFEQTRARDLSIVLVSRDGNELRVAVERGEKRRASLSAGAAGLREWVARCREVLSNPEEFVDIGSAFALPGIGAGISLPMLTGGRLIGILNFTPAQAITLGQVKALNILVSAGASALEASSLLGELRTAEQQYRQLAEGAADIVFRYELHPRKCFAYVNPAVTALTGYSPEEHYADSDMAFKIAHPDDRALMEALLRGDYPSGSTVTMRWVNKTGAVRWIEQRNVLDHDRSGRLVAIEGIARDITERKQLEEQLRHSQKMEAIGRLTAGVAHDFNNLLTVINGYSDLTLIEMTPGAPARRKIDEVRKAGEQAAALTRQLLSFGRKSVSQPRALDLNAIVKSNVNILRRVIGEDVELVTCLDSDLGSVCADAGQIEQVLLNLAVNARDAMPRGGELTIETRNADDGVMLAVGDNGCGMDAATQARVFEPFFTTKELGRGTGLGLSIVSGVVKESGGHIAIDSTPGKGTTFRIHLPRVDKPKAAGETAHGSREMPVGSEKILVVEDDAPVRELVCTVLEEAGYEVLKARNGNEALQICQQHRTRIQLVVTDLVMPQMSGPMLVEKLRELHPGMRILFTSGYADDALARYGPLDSGIPFIQKPFSPVAFLHKVREALDGAISAGLTALLT